MKQIVFVIVILAFLTSCKNEINQMEKVENKELTIKNLIAEYDYPVKYLDIMDSVQMAYVDEGAGEQTMIFIHGLASYMRAWDKLIPVFKSNYRCIAVDLPGYGKSSQGEYKADMTFYAEAINQLVNKLELKNIILIGHSMGGQVSSTVVLNYPDLAEKLILLAPAGFETFNATHKQALINFFTPESIFNSTEAQVRTNFAYNFFEMPADTEKMILDRLAMKDASDFMLYCINVSKGTQGMLNEPIFEQLGDIDIPVLVIYGANDILIPNRMLHPAMSTQSVGQDGADKIKNVTLEFISNTGHFLQYENPKEVEKLILEYLN